MNSKMENLDQKMDRLIDEMKIFFPDKQKYIAFCKALDHFDKSQSNQKFQMIYNQLSPDNLINLLMICNFIKEAQSYAQNLITDLLVKQLIAGIKRDSKNRNYVDLDLFPNSVRFENFDKNGEPITTAPKSNAYPMEGNERGIFYIVLNVPVIGTLKQMMEFAHIFSALKFKVIFRINMNKEEIMNELRELLPETGDIHSAFVLYYLGHASTNAIDCFETKLNNDCKLLYKSIFDLIKTCQLYKEKKSINLLFDCCRIRDIKFCLNQNTVPNTYGGSVNLNANLNPPTYVKIELPQLKGVLIVHSVQDCIKADFTFMDGTLFGRNFAAQLKLGALHRDIDDTLDKTSTAMESELKDEISQDYPISYPNRESVIEREFHVQYKPIQVIKFGIKRRLFLGKDIEWDQTSNGYIIKLSSDS